MRRGTACLIAAVLAATAPLLAQEPLPLTEEDLKAAASQKGFRQGVSVLPLPIIGFNSDLGFQFGAYAELYDYGRQPSIYPRYFHYLHVEASHYTKGQTFIHGEYDSSFIIPGVRFTATATWQNDPLYQFYGFNGLSAYDFSADRKDGLAYYSFKRNMVRVTTAFRGMIGGHFGWMASAAFRYFKAEDFDFDRYDSCRTLFRLYRQQGLIRDDELGGLQVDFLAGLKYDTRDSETDPSRGIWSEAYLSGSPDFFGTHYPYLKASLRWRMYWTPGPAWFTVAYHLGWQGTLAGEAPFYMQQNISSIQIRQSCTEGLGGINTVRGVLSNRLVGEDLAWGNLELRFRVLQLELAGTDILIGMNPFLDAGCITRPMKAEECASAFGISLEEVYKRSRQLHPSAGLGLKICIDTNTMLSVEWGKPFRADNGRSSIYFAMNYIF